MSHWLSQTVSRAESIDDWLSPKRQASLLLLREQSWPTRKTEAWKYTSVSTLANTNFHLQTSTNDSVANDVAVEAIEGLNSIDIVFANGRLQTDISVLDLPKGLTVISLEDIHAQNLAASHTFASIKPSRHLFGLVNDVLATTGLSIEVEDGVVVEPPIRIIHRLSEGQEAHVRVLMRVGQNAKATLIEDFNGCETSFNTVFSECDIADNAELEHYRFMLQTGNALSVGGCHFKLAEKSSLNSTLVGFGSDLARLDTDVIYSGEHAKAKLNAVYLLDGSELFDLHSTIEHAVPLCTTEENVRGIVADRSRAVFNGRIHIHRGAQKTLAELNNRNLLLSRKAEINTKPELEIYADDVRCAHGATIAEIDKEALYYLQSRGVSKEQAQVMLSFGFINELVEQMPNQTLAEWLRPRLRQRFLEMKMQ